MSRRLSRTPGCAMRCWRSGKGRPRSSSECRTSSKTPGTPSSARRSARWTSRASSATSPSSSNGWNGWSNGSGRECFEGSPASPAVLRRAPSVRLAVAALTAIAAALRFSTLDRQSFWLDELVTVSLVRRSFGGMLHAIPHSEATPYLYYVLAWPWTHVFGSGEVGVRSLSALAGTVTVVAAYGAGAALLSRRIGLIAAALVAVNPFLVWHSQEARSYALVTLFVAVGLWFFARALNGERRALAGWALASSLALATHYFAGFVVFVEAVILLAEVPERRRTVVAALIPSAVFAAQLPLLLEQRGNGQSVAQSSIAKRIVGVPKDLVVGFSFPGELYGTIVAVLLVVVGLFLLARRTPADQRRRALLTGAIAAFAVGAPIVIAGSGADYVSARNAIVALVPGAVCLSAGYAASRAGLVAASALCTLSLAIALSVSLDTKYGRTDWRGLAATIGPS